MAAFGTTLLVADRAESARLVVVTAPADAPAAIAEQTLAGAVIEYLERVPARPLVAIGVRRGQAHALEIYDAGMHLAGALPLGARARDVDFWNGGTKPSWSAPGSSSIHRGSIRTSRAGMPRRISDST